jgi:hypothetical protein
MAFCTQCGRREDPAGRYCTGCGTPLHAAAREPRASEPPRGSEPPIGKPSAPVWEQPLFPAQGDAYSLAAPERSDRGESLYLAPAKSPARENAGDLAVGPGPLGDPRATRDVETSGPSGRRTKIFAAVAALVAVAAAVTAWQIHGHTARLAAGTAHRPTAGTGQTGTAGSLQPESPAQSPVPSPGGSQSESPITSPSPSTTVGSNAVAIAPGVSQQSGSQQIAAFLESYFEAINDHNYQEYSSLFDPQIRQGLTAGAFNSGYRSTTDSGATLVGIAATDAGDIAASVTFTSHQNPADSPDHTGCTDWNITLFLEQQGGGYLIGQPPHGYHASSQPCT